MPAKFDRCVRHIAKRKGIRSAYSVCAVALKRRKNPLAAHDKASLARYLAQHEEMRRFKPFFVVSATRAGVTTYLNPDSKFGKKLAAAKRFASQSDAIYHAKRMLKQFPHLSGYKVGIRVGY